MFSFFFRIFLIYQNINKNIINIRNCNLEVTGSSHVGNLRVGER